MQTFIILCLACGHVHVLHTFVSNLVNLCEHLKQTFKLTVHLHVRDGNQCNWICYSKFVILFLSNFLYALTVK